MTHAADPRPQAPRLPLAESPSSSPWRPTAPQAGRRPSRRAADGRGAGPRGAPAWTPRGHDAHARAPPGRTPPAGRPGLSRRAGRRAQGGGRRAAGAGDQRGRRRLPRRRANGDGARTGARGRLRRPARDRRARDPGKRAGGLPGMAGRAPRADRSSCTTRPTCAAGRRCASDCAAGAWSVLFVLAATARGRPRPPTICCPSWPPATMRCPGPSALSDQRRTPASRPRRLSAATCA